jgi:hypothetical protein
MCGAHRKSFFVRIELAWLPESFTGVDHAQGFLAHATCFQASVAVGAVRKGRFPPLTDTQRCYESVQTDGFAGTPNANEGAFLTAPSILTKKDQMNGRSFVEIPNFMPFIRRSKNCKNDQLFREEVK